MAGYIGTTPVPQATQHRESFTATGGQTSFATAGYTPQFIDVYLNGVKLAPADYTATNGSDVVLASGATASDILEIVAYTPFEVANQTFTGDTSVTNLTVTGTFTSQGIDDNADAVAITIDSSENVGIGTTSPSYKLDVDGEIRIKTNTNGLIMQTSTSSDVNVLRITGGNNVVLRDSTNSDALTIDSSGAVIINNSGGDAQLYLGGTSGSDRMYLARSGNNGFLWNVDSGYFVFATNNSEAMRIDSSGNLLVGTTDDTPVGSGGISLRNEGRIDVSRDGGVAANFDRRTSDGNIVQFFKDGTTVGSIQARSSFTTLQIGSTGTGITGTSSHKILPSVNNARSDNTNDLGDDSYRWKDLYLSGGVYLGGTGSANKLEDYEEGSWTPQVAGLSGGTNPTMGSNNYGWYVKVGNIVHVGGTLHVTAAGSISGSTIVSGLPFALAGTSNARSSGSLGANAGVFTADSSYPELAIAADPNDSFFYVVKKNDQTNAYLHTVSVTTGHFYGFAVSYETA